MQKRFSTSVTHKLFKLRKGMTYISDLEQIFDESEIIENTAIKNVIDSVKNITRSEEQENGLFV